MDPPGRAEANTNPFIEPPKEQPLEVHHFSQAQVAVISQHCMQMARTLMRENDAEMIETAVRSTDFHHRIAAAWAYALTKNDNNCLLALLTDRHPLVSHAARESCVYLAKHKFGDMRTDFGPVLGSDQSAKDDAAALWQLYFDKKKKKTEAPKTETVKPRAPDFDPTLAEKLGLKRPKE